MHKNFKDALKAHRPEVIKVNNKGMIYYQSTFDKVILALNRID